MCQNREGDATSISLGEETLNSSNENLTEQNITAYMDYGQPQKVAER